MREPRTRPWGLRSPRLPVHEARFRGPLFGGDEDPRRSPSGGASRLEARMHSPTHFVISAKGPAPQRFANGGAVSPPTLV